MAHRISRILDRFAELKFEIQEAALRDSRFRALCEDYEAASEALEFWARSADARRTRMMKEYRALLSDLEAEIFSLIRGGG